MATASLSASARSGTGKGVARTLRRDGRVPAVIYGHARAPQSLSVDARELGRLLDKHSAETTVIELAVDGTMSRTLIRDIQRHPVKRAILHVDFQELVAGEKVTVNIPLVIVGTSIGVRLNAGILTQVTSELACRVDPANIPNRIEVDVTNVNIGGSVHVSDLTIPEGVELIADEGDTVLTVSAPKTGEETPAGGEPSAAEPELIRKPKAEEEGEAKK
ncbi:MAG TPA: 50S ribosomal protein L25/general stress protein Ctc [Gemmatimonadaceae bacterium]|nr:50S ribosomal protein L25/general stress protein Ctc [Gemmatimonadaceae bacterium]